MCVFALFGFRTHLDTHNYKVVHCNIYNFEIRLSKYFVVHWLVCGAVFLLVVRLLFPSSISPSSSSVATPPSVILTTHIFVCLFVLINYHNFCNFFRLYKKHISLSLHSWVVATREIQFHFIFFFRAAVLLKCFFSLSSSFNIFWNISVVSFLFLCARFIFWTSDTNAITLVKRQPFKI